MRITGASLRSFLRLQLAELSGRRSGLDVTGGHIAEHGSAKKFIMWTIIAWGGLSTLTGFVHNSWQLLVMRFLLGVAEGGVYPAILVVVGKWFPKKELGRANALFLTNLPLSAVLTNPVSEQLALAVLL